MRRQQACLPRAWRVGVKATLDRTGELVRFWVGQASIWVVDKRGEVLTGDKGGLAIWEQMAQHALECRLRQVLQNCRALLGGATRWGALLSYRRRYRVLRICRRVPRRLCALPRATWSIDTASGRSQLHSTCPCSCSSAARPSVLWSMLSLMVLASVVHGTASSAL